MAPRPERRTRRARGAASASRRPADASTASAPHRADDPVGSYFDRSRRPLEILALLAPLVVIYEVGLVSTLRHGDWVVTNRAHSSLLALFHRAGIRAEQLLLPAMSLPALALVVVLLVWQALSRRPWTLHLPTVGGMAIESLSTAIPVVLLGWIVAPLAGVLAASTDAALVEGLSVPGRIAMAIGAGIYEEFLFRLVLVSVLHSLFKRIPRVGDRGAVVAAVVIAAVAFSLHHPVVREGRLDLHDALFLFAAGCWWGALFVVRGLGIAVGSHACYDVLVIALPLLSRPDSS